MGKLARWASGTLLVFAWASACSGGDKTVVADGGAGEAGQANLGGGGPGSGGSSSPGALAGAAGETVGTGGANLGEAGASSGGATAGGADSQGGQGGAGETDVCPTAPAESSGAGCAWKSVAACNTGVTIADWCGAGMRAAKLQRCADAVLYTPDAEYAAFALAACPDGGCPVDPEHVVWRCIECCPAQ